MMLDNKGTIVRYNQGRGFGFIQITGHSQIKQDIWFHISKVEYQNEDEISLNHAAVEFSYEKNHKGYIATKVLVIADGERLIDEQSTIAALKNIKEWTLDAKHEPMGRYFYELDEAEDIKNGKKSYVIGRKGCGKTALSHNLVGEQKFDTFSHRLTFKNFPFNNLYALDNKDYTRPNQYISLWKNLIYSSICKMMAENNNIDREIRDVLQPIYGKGRAIDNLRKDIKKWTANEYEISVAGFGGKVGFQETDQNWLERVDILEEVISEYIDEAEYFIVFDELDEDYKDIVDKGQHSDYIALITSLFKAVQDIRGDFDLNVAKIRPVVFLRDDIYDLILDPDKNKWEDFRIDIDWKVDRIRKMLAHRISKAISDDNESILEFDDAWHAVFSRKPVGVGSKAKNLISSFDFITRATHLRPRDYIRYLKVAAEETLERGDSLISPTTVKTVDKGFSNYLRNELVDELHATLPDIQEIFSIISEIRKWVFSVEEFKEIYEDRLEKEILRTKDPDYVLKTLFHFSVIGNQARAGVNFFRYTNKEARFNFKEKVVVHRGLFKALQIL